MDSAGLLRQYAEVLSELLPGETPQPDSHFFEDLGADSMVMARFCARLRKNPELPSPSMKDVYQHPTIRRLAVALPGPAVPSPARPAADGAEAAMGAVAADVLGLDSVDPDSHFFDDLGADSMLMARFCARVRKRPELPSPSMKDVYRNPTLRRLAAALSADAPPPAAGPTAAPEPQEPPEPPLEPARASTLAYWCCGAAQLAALLGYALGAAVVAEAGYRWVFAGEGLLELYLRSVGAGLVAFGGMSLLPVAAKWLLVGRWTERRFPVWGPAYVRFWVVKTLLRTNPLLLLVHGSPLHVLYLRALGAKIGRGVTILSTTTPVCTDLLRIGDGTIVRKDALVNGYRARSGWIETGPVTLGRDVFVGENTVIDIGVTMGDGSQLGHASSLHRGQVVPAGESWHGTPARRTTVDHRRVRAAACGTARRFRYGALQLCYLLALYLPLGIGGTDLVLQRFGDLSVPWLSGASSSAGGLLLQAMAFSAALYFGLIAAGLLAVLVVPRLIAPLARPGRVYPLYGAHYSLHRLVARLTNLRVYLHLFGDSSYVVPYLRALGWDLRPVAQTGSNFGTAVKHETPFLSRVGTGTMVADGLSVMNAEFSSTSFRLVGTSIGARNFLGNRIAYPAGGRTGVNVLLATKVLVPLDGPVRRNTGLLGSPPFEIPRTVLRDANFDHLATGPGFARRLRRKNRHNLGTIGLVLLTRWLNVLGLTLLGLAAAAGHERWGALAIAAQLVLSLLFTLVWFALVERAAGGFGALRPRTVSVYDRYFWRHERFWKLVLPAGPDRFLAGTPFRNVLSRALGTRVGARVFDDGCAMPERSLVTVGDDACLNAGSVVQTHSQEDGAFKSGRSRIGAGVTLAPGAFVHYGVVVGDGAFVGPDSFLMKGEEVPPGAYWAGNPAREVWAPGVPAVPAAVPAAEHPPAVVQQIGAMA